MGLPAVFSVVPFLSILFALVAAVSIVFWWLASRRRIAAAETVDRARAEADRLVRQAERDAETLRKEAALEAREKAHTVAADSDKQIRQRRDEIASLEQALSEKTRTLTDRLASCDRLEKDLGVRTEAITQHEAAAATARTRADQLLAERHRELLQPEDRLDGVRRQPTSEQHLGPVDLRRFRRDALRQHQEARQLRVEDRLAVR